LSGKRKFAHKIQDQIYLQIFVFALKKKKKLYCKFVCEKSTPDFKIKQTEKKLAYH